MRFLYQLRNALRWLVLSIFVGILAGPASALLIVLLNWRPPRAKLIAG